ncbi:hypothetical protein BDW62DRAFT_178321 [Aspergillus aurantiobrunneus]
MAGIDVCIHQGHPCCLVCSVLCSLSSAREFRLKYVSNDRKQYPYSVQDIEHTYTTRDVRPKWSCRCCKTIDIGHRASPLT